MRSHALNGLLPDDANETACVFRPDTPDMDAITWIEQHRRELDTALRMHGAVLFRGFAVQGQQTLAALVEATSSRWAEYREPATPRVALGANIFTSTEYPADQRIPLHNENSHCTSWPLKIYFMCAVPAKSGGQTPIADCRRVLGSIPPAIVDEFVARRWRYNRHFGGMLGFKWQTVFNTDERWRVEAYCRENAMQFRWVDDALTITYVRDAVHQHPVTGDRVWFNHGLFFNPISMAPSLRELLLAEFSEDELPYNTSYGDGGRIPNHVLAAIEQAYESNTRQFDWERGDILMLDNMLMAHGRNPFMGERRILVGMADSWPQRQDAA